VGRRSRTGKVGTDFREAALGGLGDYGRAESVSQPARVGVITTGARI
jgi:hypothetical protein